MSVVDGGYLDAQTSVRAWRGFANRLIVNGPSGLVTWSEYLKRYGGGHADERTIVGPVAFPAFAEQLLGYEVGQTLAAEVSGAEGRPDFTPADAVTHPFVFEVKGTDGREFLSGHDAQVQRYLTQGRERIKRLVLTNLYGLRVFELDEDGHRVLELLRVDLRLLATIPEAHALTHAHAQRLADFINDHRYRRLTLAQKIDRVKEAPPWNPGLEITAPGWVLRRLESVVEAIRTDVRAKVDAGCLLNPTILLPADRPLVERELRELDKRLGSSDTDAGARTLADYVAAGPNAKPGLALQQFVAHTAFYTATRLLLVRAWEDSELLVPAALYDGGFNVLMSALQSVSEVVATAFGRAAGKYPDLFSRHNAFSWYQPSEEVYVDAVYDLANTYLGDLSDDILGEIYERQLARVDRKQLGQYYTPRDIIRLILDLADVAALATEAEHEDRSLRVLDVATGSGGFLVGTAARLRSRVLEARRAGATVDVRAWLEEVTDGLIGCEIQQFSAYLAEVNLVLQFSPLLRGNPDLRLPALRIHCSDTLTLHNPDGALNDPNGQSVIDASGVQTEPEVVERRDSLERLRDPHTSAEWLDLAVGNPPYVGEKSIAATVSDLMDRHPFWRQFSTSHQDYLYYFLILGISKLRKGGRFGFITTEYWLKATGAAPLREYLARHTRIDRLVLFRDLTLFPDAPGQHNLIVVGERVTDPADSKRARPAGSRKPKVSVYVGPARPATREPTLEAIRAGRNAPGQALVRSFESQRDPAGLGSASWSEVVMTRAQIARRDAVRRTPSKVGLVMSEGVIATPQTLRPTHARHLSQATLSQVGGPDSRAGIFVLSDDEWRALAEAGGGFTEAETEHIRPALNTRDVYPYAAVLPDRPDRLIWLPGSHGGSRGQFPEGMPTLERHLKRFKPLLEATVEGYRASRPWWSAHRARLELVEGHPSQEGWADLAVTTRWGDRKLVTGLAPAHSLPLSGLHAMTGSGKTTAAYLVGLINSTPVQELAEALAPGSVSQEDFQELGLPQFEASVAKEIEKHVRSLADLVHGLVAKHGAVWPWLPDVLRSDITLASDVFDAWSPKPGRRGWGTVSSVAWVRIEDNGASGSIDSTELSDDLLGRHLVVHFSRGRLLVDTDEHPTHDLRVLLDAIVRGSGRLSPADVAALPIPVKADDSVELWDQQYAVTLDSIRKYQALREKIDELVLAALGTR